MLLSFLSSCFWKIRVRNCVFLDSSKSEHKYCSDISFTVMKNSVLAYAYFLYVFCGQNAPLLHLPGAQSKSKAQLGLCTGCRTEPWLTKCMAKELFCSYIRAEWECFPEHKLLFTISKLQGGTPDMDKWKTGVALILNFHAFKQVINLHIWMPAM